MGVSFREKRNLTSLPEAWWYHSAAKLLCFNRVGCRHTIEEWRGSG